jgi:protease I
MEQKLRGRKIAILVTHGFEQVELTEPRKALQQAGADTKVVSPAEGKVKGWNFTEWGDEIPVDVPLPQARAEDYDALLLPGGVMNPDQLRVMPPALAFVREFFESRKPVAVICHGPWTLIDAGVVRGRRITSWPSVRTDLVNAGADWVDGEAIVDHGLVSSRKPDDIPQFNAAMIEEFAEGRHAAQRAA